MGASAPILIIGGTRFIGPPLVAKLIEAGHEVVLFHRGQSDAWVPASVRHIQGDHKDLASFRGIFAELAPRAVIHMVAYTERDATTFMQTFSGIVPRAIVLSSMDVYAAYDRLRRRDPGPPYPMPLSEDSPLRSRLYPYRDKAKNDQDLAYNYEKIVVERIVMDDPRLPATVLRLPAVYGPLDYQHRNFGYIKRMDDRRPFILLNQAQMDWRWTRGYVENVAAAIALATTDDRAVGRIYNVGEQVAFTESQWVQRIGSICGWSGRVLGLPEERLPAHLHEDFDWSQQWVADTSRLRRELGVDESVGADEALARTVEWERQNPPPNIDPAKFDYAAEDAAVAQSAGPGRIID